MGKLDAAVKDAATKSMEELNLRDDPEEGLVKTDEGTAPEKVTEATKEKPAPTSGSEEEEKEVETDESVSDEAIAEFERFHRVDLSVLPEPERKTFIREWTEQQKQFSKLQRENAELKTAKESPKPVETAVEPEPISDEVLAQALRLDLEDPDDARLAERLIPLARMNLELKDQLSQVSTTVSTDSESRYWTAELDRLEARFGPLPVERVEVLERAAEAGIANPEAAYWLVSGPVRQSAADKLSQALKLSRSTAKKDATTPRPTSTPSAKSTKLESKTTKDAIREAAELAAEELGYDWEDARRKSIGLD